MVALRGGPIAKNEAADRTRGELGTIDREGDQRQKQGKTVTGSARLGRCRH